jgi:hypothetical protein
LSASDLREEIGVDAYGLEDRHWAGGQAVCAATIRIEASLNKLTFEVTRSILLTPSPARVR